MVRRWVLIGSLAAVGWLAPRGATAQEREVTGTVTRESGGQPIPEATVSVVGGRAVAKTNAQGRFTLSAPPGDVRLAVRAIGYQRAEAVLPAATSSVDVQLKEDIFKLDELVVSGQQTGIERKNAATSTAVVTGEDLTQIPAPTIDRALQGKVAGANIAQNSGAPGGGIQVQIRGNGTVLGSPDPLFVVDGVIYSNASIATGRKDITAGIDNAEDDPVNRLADLNPNDIVSIEVLKSAAASSIYGSKAANGVVVITTNRGQLGKPHVDVTQRVGFSSLLRGYQFRQWTYDDAVGFFGDAAKPFFGADQQPLQRHDHLGDLTGQRSLAYETAVSASGGNENTKYFISGGFNKNPGIIEGTGAQKQNVRVNVDQILGRKWSARVSTTFGFANNVNTFDSYTYALAYIPDFVAQQQSPDGTWPSPSPGASPVNPFQLAALAKNQDETYRFTGGGDVTYQAVATERQNLKFVFAGGADIFNQTTSLYKPPELFSEAARPTPGQTVLGNGQSRLLNWNLNGIHTYSPGGFRATTSVGLQYEERRLNTERTSNQGLVSGVSNVTGGAVVGVFQNNTQERTLAIYANEDFLTLGDRLLLAAGVRAERSSVNGNSDKYFIFPKFSASYRFPGLIGEGSEVKLRGAYGETGNQPLFGQRYTNLTLVAAGGLAGAGLQGALSNGGAGGVTFGLNTIEPERVKEFEAGVDLSFWKSRGTLELTGFSRRTTNLLLNRTPAWSLGFGQEALNGGVFRNQGIEVAFGVTPVQARNASWLFRSTFTTLRNKVVSIPVPAFAPGGNTSGFGNTFGQFIIEEGKPITQIIGNARIENGVPVADKIGDANPSFRWTFGNDITYKNTFLSFLWDWQQGGTTVDVFNWLVYQYGNAFDSNTPAGQALQDAANNGIAAPFAESATFLKLREVSVGLNLPRRIARVFGGSSLKLSLTGRNLLMFTSYKGFDPEVSNFGSQAISRSLDVAPFPSSRQFFFNVNLGF
jgi:TonB-linked SusC/RagA family outer membrane protein